MGNEGQCDSKSNKNLVNSTLERQLKKGIDQFHISPCELWTTITEAVVREVGRKGLVYLPEQESFCRRLSSVCLMALPCALTTAARLKETGILDRFKVMADSKTFLIYLTLGEWERAGEDLILRWSSPDQLALLETAEILYVDGTFPCISSPGLKR